MRTRASSSGAPGAAPAFRPLSLAVINSERPAMVAREAAIAKKQGGGRASRIGGLVPRKAEAETAAALASRSCREKGAERRSLP